MNETNFAQPMIPEHRRSWKEMAPYIVAFVAVLCLLAYLYFHKQSNVVSEKRKLDIINSLNEASAKNPVSAAEKKSVVESVTPAKGTFNAISEQDKLKILQALTAK
jgi:F0F1-type ATP synthase membrane subunit b/b'